MTARFSDTSSSKIGTTVHPIKLRLSNAYLLKGKRSVLVDTGSPGEAEKILEALESHGMTLADLALILHTHVHSDHVGGTADLLKLHNFPVAYHRGDEGLMRLSNNGRLTGVGLRGKVMARVFSGGVFERFEPTFYLEDSMRLDDYGVAATVIHTPGHTSGSVSILLDSGEAIVGDLWMGGFLGGAFLPRRPNPHYFAEDEEELRRSMSKVLEHKPTTLYVGHGGPLKPDDLRRRFGR